MARTRALYAPPNALSLSPMRLRRRVLGHRKSQQLSALMAKDETYEESPKGNRWNDKQVNGCYNFPMIAKERFLALQRPALLGTM